MSVQELMTMLNPKNVRFDSGSGGVPTMTWDDVAAAAGMAGLTRAERCVFWVKYCDDVNSVDELLNCIKSELLSMSALDGWRKGFKISTLHGLARLALINEVDNRKCKSCGGTGFVKAVICKPCESSGVRQMSNRRMAKLCQIDEKAWRNTWSDRYSDLLLTIGDWEHSAARKIGKKLFEARV